MTTREALIGRRAARAAEPYGVKEHVSAEAAETLARFVLHADVLGGEPLYRWAVAEGFAREQAPPWRELSDEARDFWNVFVAVVHALEPLFPEEDAAPAPAPVVDRRPPRREETIFARDERAFDSAYPEAVRRGETTTAGIAVRHDEPVLASHRHEASAPAFSVSYNMGAAGVVSETPKGERFDPAAFLAQARADYTEAFEAQGLDPATAALRAEAMTSGPAGQRLAAEAAPPPLSREPVYDQVEIVETDASAFLAPGEKAPAKGRFVTRRKGGV